jgi:hypothetical protein
VAGTSQLANYAAAFQRLVICQQGHNLARRWQTNGVWQTYFLIAVAAAFLGWRFARGSPLLVSAVVMARVEAKPFHIAIFTDPWSPSRRRWRSFDYAADPGRTHLPPAG